jgi:hypothetical protein
MMKISRKFSYLYGILPLVTRKLLTPLESPSLTGIPTAPTPSLGTQNNQVATTAFVSVDTALTKAP